jgi:hypothetical protein
MQKLEFNKPNNLSQLHDEIIAQVPNFHRVVIGQDGLNKATEDWGRVEGLDDLIRISFADDIDPAKITAVVNAHEPKPKSPSRLEVLYEKLKQNTITYGGIMEMLRLERGL